MSVVYLSLHICRLTPVFKGRNTKCHHMTIAKLTAWLSNMQLYRILHLLGNEDEVTTPDNHTWTFDTFVEAFVDAAQICEGTESFLKHHNIMNYTGPTTDVRSEEYEGLAAYLERNNLTCRDNASDYNMWRNVAPFIKQVI